MKRLDGTKAYPLKVAQVVADLRKRYQRHLQNEKKAIDAALQKEQKTALKDRKSTGPRQTEELFYITWLPESQHLRVHFRTRVSDGAYQMGGGANIDLDLVPLRHIRFAAREPLARPHLRPASLAVHRRVLLGSASAPSSASSSAWPTR